MRNNLVDCWRISILREYGMDLLRNLNDRSGDDVIR